MKLGRISISLANPAKAPNQNELGTAGTANTPSFFNGEIITAFEKIKTDDLIKMHDQDGTASALFQVITMPVQANPWGLEPEDETPEAKQQAEWAEEKLKMPPYKGGMTTPFDLVLADMLRAPLEGWRAYEKVFALNEQGQIVYRKIAPRDQSTVTLQQDDRGGFNGFKQSAYIGKEYKEVVIPREYAFLFTFGKQWHPLRGKSAFRAAYYHYEKKHRLYYVAHQLAQFGAIAPKVVKAPKGAKQSQIDAHVALADQLGFSSTIGLPHDWVLDAYDAAKGRYDPMGLIDHHNAEMARSILAQFIMLGTGGKGTTGSWALSQDQSDMFVLALRGLISNIEQHITSYILPDLIEYNFANPKYPKFKFANLTDATVNLLKEVALKILDKRPEGIPTEMVEGIVKKLAVQLGIDLPEDSKREDVDAELPAEAQAAIETAGAEIQKQALNGAQIASLLAIVQQVVLGQMPYEAAFETMKVSFPAIDEATITKILAPAKDFTPDAAAPAPVNQARARKFITALSRSAGKPHFLADERWKRPLTPAEKKVNFSAIQTKYNTLEEAFAEAAKPLFDEARETAVADIAALIEAEDWPAVEAYQVKLPDDYRQLILDKMIDAYGYAKSGAADELGVAAPATPKKSKELISQEAQQIIDKQQADLTFEIKAIITEARRKNNLSRENIELKINPAALAIISERISEAMAGFFDSRIVATGSVIISSAINRGRDDTFEANEEKIASYQYSAILDETTCGICEDLDGSVTSPEDYASTRWVPPIHFNCRCLWVAILANEQERPDISGLPEAPGGVMEPALAEHFKYAIGLSLKKVGQ